MLPRLTHTPPKAHESVGSHRLVMGCGFCWLAPFRHGLLSFARCVALCPRFGHEAAVAAAWCTFTLSVCFCTPGKGESPLEHEPGKGSIFAQAPLDSSH